MASFKLQQTWRTRVVHDDKIWEMTSGKNDNYVTEKYALEIQSPNVTGSDATE